MEFRQSLLPNGLQVIGEINSRAQSAAVGFYVRTGSRNETAECSGVSHFLEHMAFKGNGRFSAADVNRVFDELGVDHIYIDEAHFFKNLETPTKMERVAGIQTGGSERAFDLYMKARYLD